jgi:exodeoxyribonuclease VII small subunit
MTDHQTQSDDPIVAKTDRLEAIISELEDGDVSLGRAQQLHAEGESLLKELEEELNLGDTEIIERP